jgi:periplasmic copper chaperone A
MLTLANASFGHIVLDEPVALANTSYRATFRIGHGCGASSTTAIRVRIPAGFQGAKPMPHAGWQLVVRDEKLAVPYKSHGKEVTQDVVEVSWTARTPADALPDAHYDEFTLRGTVPGSAGPLWFKVLQTCGGDANDWSEVPASGTSTKGLKAPAILLEVLPPKTAGEHAH